MEVLESLIQVSLSVIAALSYCYFFASRIPPGKPRLLSLSPVFYLFCHLPWRFSSINLRGDAAFFLTWLANFKLALFAFNEGPLSTQLSSFLNFICIASLPIKIKPRNPAQETQKKFSVKFSFSFCFKAALLGLLFHIYRYKLFFPRCLLLLLYSCHLYLSLELMLSTAAAAGAAAGMDLEPQFDAPYLSTSLQDFWGRRWNLMVTGILRPTVYLPVRRLAGRSLGLEPARVAAILAVFVVSGAMHEVMFFYLSSARPRWDGMGFFLLHGVCTAVEVAVKKATAGRFQPPAAVARAATLGFVAVTSFWLFFPALMRNGTDTKAIEEYRSLLQFLQEIFLFKSNFA